MCEVTFPLTVKLFTLTELSAMFFFFKNLKSQIKANNKIMSSMNK